MNETLRIRIESEAFPPDVVEVARVDGRERISQLFDFEILAVSKNADAFDVEELVGAAAELVFEDEGGELRRIFGMIASVNDRLDTETSLAHFRLRFVPRAFRLTLVELCDIYLDQSVPDVVRQKLGDAGFVEGADFEMRLLDGYPARELIVQYKETDLAFVSRLCEHLGVSFFFEHTGGRDVMVFTDMNEGFRDVAGAAKVPFQRRGDRRDVYELEETVRMIPGMYVVQDYNYRTPQMVLTGSAQLSTGVGGVVEYGTHVKTTEEATKMALIRSEERLAGRRVFQGASDLVALQAGARTALEGHPRGDLALLLVEVEHHAELAALGRGTAEGGYHNRFQGILASRRFRPARVTPKPRIHGVVTGIIDADGDGKYADVDDQGRYRVRFIFDATGPNDEWRSRPVRMAQPHAGAGYGMHFPLRPGVEVILTFVDGDPDRPIITATVPNPQTASPVTSGNAPRNIIRTGGGNEINIDDTEGSERIKISTPHSGSTLQLGAPNLNEAGIALSTTSNVSTISGLTANDLTTFGTVFGQWVSTMNNHVTNVAGKLVKPMVIAMRLGMADAIFGAVLGTASTALGLVVSTYQLSADTAALDAEKKQKKLQETADARREKEKTLEDELGKATYTAGSDADNARKELLAAIAAYRAALKKLEEDQAADADLVAERDAAEAAGKTTIVEAKNAEIDAYEKRKSDTQPDKGILQLDEEALEGEDGKGGAKKRLEDAIKAAKEKCTTPSSLATAITEYEEKNSAFQSDRSDYLAAQATSDDIASHAKGFEDVTTAQGYVDQVSAGYSIVSGAINTGLSLYSAIATAMGISIDAYAAGVANLLSLEATRQYASPGLPKVSWTDSDMLSSVASTTAPAPDTYKTISRVDWKTGYPKLVDPAGSPLWKFSASPQWKESRQLVGSEEHTVVFARETVHVAGQAYVAISSRDKVAITANDMASVHSRHKTEVAGGESVQVTSATLVDILSRGTVKISAVDATTNVDKERSVVDLTGTDLTLTVNDAADTEKAKLKLSVSKIEGTADEVVLNAAQTARILAGANGDWGLAINGTTGEVNLGSDNWYLMIKDSDVSLGGPTAYAEIKAAKAHIQSSSSTYVTLAAAGATIKGTQIKLDGTLVDAAGALLIRG